MDKQLQEHLMRRSTWIRAAFMIFFVIIYSIAKVVVWVIAVFQLISLLLTGQINQNLLPFGQGLSTFLYQVLRFLTFNTEEKPFPFSEWPGTKTPATQPEGTAESQESTPPNLEIPPKSED